MRRIRDDAGRGDRPAAARLLQRACRAGGLEQNDLQELIAEIWVMLDRPAGPPGHGALTDGEWLELFTMSGFFVTPKKLPFNVSDPMRIYRASTDERCRGMSWCNYREMAERFLPKDHRRSAWRIWTAEVPRSAILAVLFRPDDSVFHLPYAAAREIVVDPTQLPSGLEVV
jgi:hypothetical protein